MKTNLKTKNVVLCSFFTALIIIGAFIKIPVPVVPFTLQFLFTMLAGNLLGGKKGALSVGIYILIGLIGIPVFTEGGGIWYIFKPSFGYIIGFLVAAFVTGEIIAKNNKLSVLKIIGINFIGLFIVYAFGMIYYYIICNFVINTPIGLWPLFLYCFILAVPGDICLCILAAFLTKRLKPIINMNMC